MATKNLNPESKDQQEQKNQRKNILQSAALMATAATGGGVLGACISKAQTEEEPTKPEPVNVATPILEEKEPANPEYTGPTYQYDPESATGHQQGNVTGHASGNGAQGNATNSNNGGNTPTNNIGGGSANNPTPEEEAAKREIEHNEIDPNDLDEEDAFTVLGFATRFTESGEEIEVAVIVDDEGNQLLLRDVDGNGKYDTVYTTDNELVGMFKSESLSKSDLIEKMQTYGYINPIEENIPPYILPTGEDIAILDANDSEIEEIVNNMISENINYMALANVSTSADEENDEEDVPFHGGEEDVDDNEEYDYDDTVNEEEILAMIDNDDDDSNDDDDDDDSDDDDDDCGYDLGGKDDLDETES